MHKDHGGLNFHNMEAFNLAMIGKQGWKLLSNNNSLLARALKARHYPKKGFLEADLGHNPSFTWRSVWSSQPLIKLGCCWKIGNGRNINVWRDSWLRTLSHSILSTIMVPSLATLTVPSVRDLMDQNGCSWNKPLVQTIFNESDANVILSMPLFLCSGEDSCIWTFSSNGNYYVKPAYRLCMDNVHSHSTIQAQFNWKAIWKLQVSHRVRAFIWRMAHDCLPTRWKLSNRGVPCPSIYRFANKILK